jgi:hypothetical protein
MIFICLTIVDLPDSPAPVDQAKIHNESSKVNTNYTIDTIAWHFPPHRVNEFKSISIEVN